MFSVYLSVLVVTPHDLLMVILSFTEVTVTLSVTHSLRDIQSSSRACHVTSIMPRFLTGDELGSIKSVSYNPNGPTETNLQLKTLHDGTTTTTGRTRGVQKLAIGRGDTALVCTLRIKKNQDATNNAQDKLASAHADGSVRLSLLSDEDELEQQHEWKETRIQPDQTFVGLASTQKYVFEFQLRVGVLSENGVALYSHARRTVHSG